MSGNDRRMRARRREEDEAEEVQQQQHMFSRTLTNLEVVEFGEARAESHSPKESERCIYPMHRAHSRLGSDRNDKMAQCQNRARLERHCPLTRTSVLQPRERRAPPQVVA